jgi:hypothetical protein
MIWLGIIAGVLVIGYAVYATATNQLIPVSSDGNGGDSEDSTDMTETSFSPDASNQPSNGIDPTDDSTWPSGDNIWNICHAVAYAEGYNVAGSVPARLCNPGDLSDGFSQYGGESHSGSNVTHFPDQQTGWQWLYNKWQNIVNGSSTTYPASLTWTQVAQKYAGNWQNWLNNVTSVLGVDPSSTPANYVNG